MTYTIIVTTDLGMERIRMTGMFLPIKEQRDIEDLILLQGRDDILDIICCMSEGEVIWVNNSQYQPSLF